MEKEDFFEVQLEGGDVLIATTEVVEVVESAAIRGMERTIRRLGLGEGDGAVTYRDDASDVVVVVSRVGTWVLSGAVVREVEGRCPTVGIDPRCAPLIVVATDPGEPSEQAS